MFGLKIDDNLTIKKIKTHILKILEETDPANQTMISWDIKWKINLHCLLKVSSIQL